MAEGKNTPGRGGVRGSNRGSRGSKAGINEENVEVPGAIGSEKKSGAAHISISMKEAAGKPQETPTEPDTQRNGSNGRKPSTPRQNKDCAGKGSKPQEEHSKEKNDTASPQATTAVTKQPSNSKRNTKVPDNSPTVDGGTGKTTNSRRKNKDCAGKGSKPQEEHSKDINDTASPQARTAVTKQVLNSKRNIKVPDNSPTVDDGTGKTTNSRRKNKDCVGKGSKPQEDSGGRCVTGSSGPNETSKRVAVMKKLSLKKDDISAAALIVNDVLTRILKSEAITKNPIFAKIEAMKTGSYYEGLKIFRPNEFDIMLKIPIKHRLELEQSDESGAFYKLSLKRLSASDPWNKYIHKESKNILQSTVINNLRKIVKDVLRKTDNIKIIRKNHNSPAITFEIKNKHETISVDLVLALEVQKNWPEKTNEGMKIGSWLGKKTKKDYRKEKIYFVAKKPRGVCNTKDLDDVWRLSFSNIEKKILTNHGHSKTCCERNEQKCCRKQCLKRLKCLLGLIKEVSSKNSLDVFCSYYAKTAFFHCCVAYPLDQEWKEENFEICFDRLVEFFLAFLVEGNLPNFFIPFHNLLLGISQNCLKLLKDEITEQKRKKYPIFKLFGADGTLIESSTFPLECRGHAQCVIEVPLLNANATPIFHWSLPSWMSAITL